MLLEMERVVVVRSARVSEAAELLRRTVMSHLNSAFVAFVFKEVVLQSMVLLSAICFIFLGLPPSWCAATVPFVVALVYLAVYAHHALKAYELTSIEPMSCWIAEVYEPYFMTGEPGEFKYNTVDEWEFKNEHDADSKRLKRKVIGTVMVRDHFGPFNKLWMYGLVVDPKYRTKGVGGSLVRKACEFTKHRGYESLDLVITDLQNEARLFFLGLGFKLHHIYHKKFFGFVPLGMYRMSLYMTSRKQ